MIRAGTGRSLHSGASRLVEVLLVVSGVSVVLAGCGTPLIPSLGSSATPTASPSAAPGSPSPGTDPPRSTSEPGSPPATPAEVSACTPDQIRFALQERPIDSGAGSFFWNLSAVNQGSIACTANGYPSVQLVSADTGLVIGAASGLDPRAAPAPVLLQPGDSAYSLLHLTRAGAYGCTLVPVTELAVTLPGAAQSGRVSTPNPIEGCDDPTIQLVRTGAFAADPVTF